MNIKFLFVSLIFMVSQNLFSQNDSMRRDNDKTEYIFDSKKMKINTLGLFVSSEMGISQLNNNLTPLGGGSFMFLINKKLGIGFAGQITGNPNNDKQIRNLGYGGIKLEYTIKPNSKIHATIPLLIGAAFANTDSARNYHYGPPNRPMGGGNRPDYNFHQRGNEFFVIQPGINLEANIIRYLKIFGGINYRLATKINDSRNTNITSPVKASQVSGITATIGLKFGLFDYQLHKKDSLNKRGRNRKF